LPFLASLEGFCEKRRLDLLAMEIADASAVQVP